MVPVGDGDVAATRAVDVVAVILGHDVAIGLAFDPLAVDLAVDVSIVDVVGVVAVGERDVAAALAVLMIVVFVDVLFSAHGKPSR